MSKSTILLTVIGMIGLFATAAKLIEERNTPKTKSNTTDFASHVLENDSKYIVFKIRTNKNWGYFEHKFKDSGNLISKSHIHDLEYLREFYSKLRQLGYQPMN